MPVRRGETTNKPALKGKLVAEIFFPLGRVCLWVILYRNIIVNLG